MIRFTAFGGVLCAAMLLVSCDSKPSIPTKADAGAPSKDAMAGMTTPAPGTTTATGSGTVTALDPETGKITLAHGAIPAAGWPAMTMAFDANPGVLKSVTVGDKVEFDLTLKGGVGVVTSLRPVK